MSIPPQVCLFDSGPILVHKQVKCQRAKKEAILFLKPLPQRHQPDQTLCILPFELMLTFLALLIWSLHILKSHRMVLIVFSLADGPGSEAFGFFAPLDN